MRRCEYYKQDISYIPWCDDYFEINFCALYKKECEGKCPDYVPVNFNPDWVEFARELNRRLNQ